MCMLIIYTNMHVRTYVISVQVSTLVNSNTLTNKHKDVRKTHKCLNVDLAYTVVVNTYF